MSDETRGWQRDPGSKEYFKVILGTMYTITKYENWDGISWRVDTCGRCGIAEPYRLSDAKRAAHVHAEERK